MSLKPYFLLPCGFFFAEGQYRLGVVTFLMQLSLVLWPAAIRLVETSQERVGVDLLLAEFAVRHRVPTDPYAKPRKTFRKAA